MALGSGLRVHTIGCALVACKALAWHGRDMALLLPSSAAWLPVNLASLEAAVLVHATLRKQRHTTLYGSHCCFSIGNGGCAVNWYRCPQQ